MYQNKMANVPDLVDKHPQKTFITAMASEVSLIRFFSPTLSYFKHYVLSTQRAEGILFAYSTAWVLSLTYFTGVPTKSGFNKRFGAN